MEIRSPALLEDATRMADQLDAEVSDAIAQAHWPVVFKFRVLFG